MKVTINAGSIGTSIAAERAHITVTPLAKPAKAKPVRMLFLASNPPATPRLRIDEEIRSIDETIRRGQHRDRFKIVTQLAARIGDLQGHLLRYRPDIVHFSGHGNAGALVLEDAAGGSHRLEPAELRAHGATRTAHPLRGTERLFQATTS